MRRGLIGCKSGRIDAQVPNYVNSSIHIYWRHEGTMSREIQTFAGEGGEDESAALNMCVEVYCFSRVAAGVPQDGTMLLTLAFRYSQNSHTPYIIPVNNFISQIF